MSLNIKNEDTVQLIRELADELGVSLTAAITEAVRVRLAAVRAQAAQPAFDVDSVLAFVGEVGDRIGHEYLGQDFDSLLYDEMGLPK